jgi:hypothetical protein
VYVLDAAAIVLSQRRACYRKTCGISRGRTASRSAQRSERRCMEQRATAAQPALGTTFAQPRRVLAAPSASKRRRQAALETRVRDRDSRRNWPWKRRAAGVRYRDPRRNWPRTRAYASGRMLGADRRLKQKCNALRECFLRNRARLAFRRWSPAAAGAGPAGPPTERVSAHRGRTELG